MNIVFLDYDGVVNNPMWINKDGHMICTYGYPGDNKVNDFQAVQWVSEFCQKYDYSIVVSSTWRFRENYKDCLVNGGLRSGIKVIDKIPRIKNASRGQEIAEWLGVHPEVENFLIFDDDDIPEFKDHLVRCTSSAGFREEEFFMAERMHQRFCNYKNIFSEKCD